MGKEISHHKKFGLFIGQSQAMMGVYDKIERLAPSDTPIFIEGASGTGKEICAQALHKYSKRKEQPFIVVNCANLTPDLIESALFGHVKGAYTGACHARDGAIKQAQNGTLFLDEIAELPLITQAKLLRFCENFSYQKLGSDTVLKANIRLVCATNKNMNDETRQGRFRHDLYYRLYVAPIQMPALKDRGADILELANFFLKNHAHSMEKNMCFFSENAQEILMHYHWPGNVRELDNIARQIISLENSQLILASMLPSKLTDKSMSNIDVGTPQTEPHIHMPLWRIEKQAIQHALALTQGNIPKAAAMLDVAPSTLYRKIKLWQTVS